MLAEGIGDREKETVDGTEARKEEDPKTHEIGEVPDPEGKTLKMEYF